MNPRLTAISAALIAAAVAAVGAAQKPAAGKPWDIDQPVRAVFRI